MLSVPLVQILSSPKQATLYSEVYPVFRAEMMVGSSSRGMLVEDGSALIASTVWACSKILL